MAGTELAKAYVQIIPSADGIKGKLSNALGGEASSAGDSAGKVAGTSLGASIKKMIAAAGIGAALKSTITEGANLQQSLGGIETLFKDSADKVIKNAQNAYLTAGLSANDYMETVTSFSASLLQGLAGDTNKAADVADMALTDMADNANKMGTSMDLIQNAYQGFAKQNYTMLDNLKLGYGGTKSEMERLLADATKITGIKYNLDNLSDVYEAIHVIQGELDITGTTSKEAASTLTGSFASMKSALSNVLGSLSLGEDIKPAMDGLITSIKTFLFNNLIPMVGNILKGLVEYIADTVVNTDWISVITQMLTSIKEALVTGIETYFGADTTVLSGIFDSLINNIPVITQTLQDAFSVLWEGIKSIWETVGVPVFDAIMSVIQYVSDNWNEISGIFQGAFQTMWDVCMTYWESIGKPIWDAIGFAIGEIQGLFAEYMPLILGFVQEAMSGIKDTWETHLKPCFEAIGDFLNTVLKPAFEFVFDAIIRPLIDNTFGFIANIWNNTLKPVFDGICDFLTGVFTLNWKKAFQGIINIVTGIWNGLVEIIKRPIELVKNIINNAVQYIKDKFNFDWHLPSLKLPHFSVSGSFSLNPLSVPSFGISWYAKAMNNPIIMDSPTAFGINSLGQIMAGGEKGSEVVSGTDTLMKMIAAAVESKNERLIEAIYILRDILLMYLPGMENRQIVLDSGAIIGELAPGMDAALGKIK